jgi:hypothetical protein
MPDLRCISPPELAKEWGIDPSTILAHIRAGRLRAFSTSPPGTKRPRWKIPPEAVAEFEATHAAQTPVKPVRSTRRRRDPQFVEYV